MKRVVPDTNTIISALFWDGVPGNVYDAALGRKVVLLTSAEMLKELEDVLSRKKFQTALVRIGRTAADIISAHQAVAEVVIVANVSEDVVRDKKDRMVVGTAVGGNADYIVSGDHDLLELEQYAGTAIVSAGVLLDLIASLPASE